MRFDIITIFPDIVRAYTNESVLKRAQKKKLISVAVHDLRDWAGDKHRSVDDSPYGGGPGMVMRADIIAKAATRLLGDRSLGSRKTRTHNPKPRTRIILFSPAGKKFTQKDAARYVKKYDRLILISGRYEGVDARVERYIANEVVSIGDYVLSGGEIPAMVVVEAVSRLVRGVLGKEESEESKRFGVGVPVYTRPEIVKIKGKKRCVPSVLLSGDHRKIAAWRRKHRKVLD